AVRILSTNQCWYDVANHTCSWPPLKNPIHAVEKQKPVEQHWPKYKARKLHQFHSYPEARRALIKAEYTSDLEKSDFEVTPKRKRSCVSKRIISNIELEDSVDSDFDVCQVSSQLKKPPCLVSVEQLQSATSKSNSDTAGIGGQSAQEIHGNAATRHIDPGMTPYSNFTPGVFPQQINNTYMPPYYPNNYFSQAAAFGSHVIRPFQFPVTNEGERVGQTVPNNNEMGLMQQRASRVEFSENNFEHQFEIPSFAIGAGGAGSQNRNVEDDVEIHCRSSQGINIPSSLDTASTNTVSNEHTTDTSQILDVLKKLVQDVSYCKNALMNIETKLTSQGCSGFQNAKTTVIISQPFQSEPEFQMFDETITEDRSQLLMSGGDTVAQFVGRVLKKVFSEELSVKFSMWGHKDNKNFSATNIWLVVKDCALSLTHIKPTEKGIERAVSEWFRHAGARLKTKTSRTGAASSEG
ncbi:unnamed protein product, partial [Orchesella dallaii]